jgi:hypothetical protein
MEQCCGPLAVEIVPGKHCDFSTYLAKSARDQSGECAEVQFPVYGTELWYPGSRNGSWKALCFQHLFANRARAQSGSCADVHFHDYEQYCGYLAVEIFPGKQESTAISAPNLPRERELSLVLAQKCSFLMMEQCCDPLAVEVIPRKHCEFSTYLTKRPGAQSGACAQVKFPDYGTVFWAPGRGNIPGKHCDFSNYLAERANAQSGACA